MKTISIPGTPFDISVLSFGATGLGTASTGEEARRLVADYVEAGGNFFDTAHNYGFWVKGCLGASERELRRVLRELGYRDNVLVATKGGHSEAGPDYRRPTDFLAENVLLCDIENSLYRLGVETIDLYYLHRDDGKTPVGEIIERMNGFIRRGWLRFLGASNWSTERIAAANAYAAEKGLQGFVISQIQGSLAASSHAPTADPTHRYLDQPTTDWHRRTGIPVVAFSATANGYFADPIPGQSERHFGNPTSQARRDRARQLARELGCTPTQVALAYLLCQPGVPVVALFSTTRQDHLKEIMASSAIALTEAQVHWLRDGS